MFSATISTRSGHVCLESLITRLAGHRIYEAIRSRAQLRTFMEHHVYAVWDFMSLLKSLQTHLAPTTVPWVPPAHGRYANFINQLVLEEESDSGLNCSSHYECYLQAMMEIGADTGPINRFVDTVRDAGFEYALQVTRIPGPSRRFMAVTFDIIERRQAHLTAAALAYGREALVPRLYRSLRQGLRTRQSDTPGLYAYLDRHIQLDEHEHGPLSVLLVQELCADSPERHAAAIKVAEQALIARLDLWDGICAALPD